MIKMQYSTSAAGGQRECECGSKNFVKNPSGFFVCSECGLVDENEPSFRTCNNNDMYDNEKFGRIVFNTPTKDGKIYTTFSPFSSKNVTLHNRELLRRAWDYQKRVNMDAAGTTANKTNKNNKQLFVMMCRDVHIDARTQAVAFSLYKEIQLKRKGIGECSRQTGQDANLVFIAAVIMETDRRESNKNRYKAVLVTWLKENARMSRKNIASKLNEDIRLIKEFRPRSCDVEKKVIFYLKKHGIENYTSKIIRLVKETVLTSHFDQIEYFTIACARLVHAYYSIELPVKREETTRKYLNFLARKTGFILVPRERRYTIARNGLWRKVIIDEVDDKFILRAGSKLFPPRFDDKFILRIGSNVVNIEECKRPSLGYRIRLIRDKRVAHASSIKESGDDITTIKDIEFNSASSAVYFVLYYVASGNEVLVLKDGISRGQTYENAYMKKNFILIQERNDLFENIFSDDIDQIFDDSLDFLCNSSIDVLIALRDVITKKLTSVKYAKKLHEISGKNDYNIVDILKDAPFIEIKGDEIRVNEDIRNAILDHVTRTISMSTRTPGLSPMIEINEKRGKTARIREQEGSHASLVVKEFLETFRFAREHRKYGPVSASSLLKKFKESSTTILSSRSVFHVMFRVLLELGMVVQDTKKRYEFTSDDKTLTTLESDLDMIIEK
jgi:hypothetical protein